MDIKIEEKKEENKKNKEILSKIEKKASIKNKGKGSERKITYLKLGMNTLLSALLLVFCIYIPYSYSEREWKMFFLMTLWSFTMNSYYIVSITVIDWIRLCKHNNKLCYCYNNFVRNIYLRVCFPFAIAIVFLYWILVLLGDDYEGFGSDISDYVIGIFFHGVILIFLLFDMCTARHINKVNYLRDLIIISILVCIYYVILGVGKYKIDYEPYDFMERSSLRQMIGACILIYIAILDGYVILNLIANRFFVQIHEKKINLYQKNKNENSSFDEKRPLNSIITENIPNDFKNKKRSQSEIFIKSKLSHKQEQKN